MDTHMWIWHVEGASAHYTPSARRWIDTAAADGRLGVSAISVWEIAMLEQKGMITLSTELHAWVASSRRPPGVRLLALTPGVLIDGPRLPPWLRQGTPVPHRDPADRWIVATARRANAVIVTCDREMLHYAEQGHVQAFDARV
jgi:PIN domain nuclease of toxin-antitoxin system